MHVAPNQSGPVTQSPPDLSGQYRFGPFTLLAGQRLLMMDGQPIALGARAFDLLLHLVVRHGHVVGKTEAIDAVWPGLVVEENNLSVQVSAIRKVLGAASITTVAGRGYRLALPVVHEPGVMLGPPATDAPPVAPRSDPATIAVLPFKVLADPGQLHFQAEGLAEDVVALLARIPGFRVISHASSFFFRDSNLPMPEVARQLGVRFMVVGSVRPTAGRVRVSVQLAEAASGVVLWSNALETTGERLDDLQSPIARGVIAELEPELRRAEIAHIRRQRPENRDAWSHYHQAVGAIAMHGWSAAALAEARDHLRQSVTIDPTFGLAHAQYALLTALSHNIGLTQDDGAPSPDAAAAALAAVELDSGSSQVLGLAGCALCDLGQRVRGVGLLQSALANDPSNAQAHVALGAAVAMDGRFEEGVASMRRGIELSPRDRRLVFWTWVLGSFLLRLDQMDEALIEADTSIRMDDRLHLSHVLKAAALARKGHPEDARSALAMARQLHPALDLKQIGQTHGRRAAESLAQLWD